MTPRAEPLASAENTGPEYACSVCATHWQYTEVRHVLCCPDCRGGLLRALPTHDSATRSPARPFAVIARMETGTRRPP